MMQEAVLMLVTIIMLLWLPSSCSHAGVLTPPPTVSPKDLLPEAPLPPSGDRSAVFISDLHLGVGHIPGNKEQWHPLEDFRWHKEFDDFLHDLNTVTKGKADLVLLGDTFELWQSLSRGDCDHSAIDKNLGCKQGEAVNRLKRVIEEHDLFFSSIDWFATQGENRVTIVPGNHDIALIFPAVSDEVMKNFPKGGDRVRIATEGYWLSSDGLIYAEHGQQMDGDPNQFRGWPRRPIWKETTNLGNDTLYLDQPWGERLVQDIFNTYEERYQTIDNLSEEIAGISYAMKAVGVIKATEEVAQLARFILTGTSWHQFGQFLGPEGIPVWDIKAIRNQSSTERVHFLANSFPQGDPIRDVLEELINAGARIPIPPDKTKTIRDEWELSDEELRSICNRRWLAIESKQANGMTPCPSTGKLGFVGTLISDALLVEDIRNERYRSYLTGRRDTLPTTKRPTKFFKLFVYGHTHMINNNYRPFSTGAGWGATIYNNGAWQRTATPQQFCAIAREKKFPEADALRLMKVEDLPPCYPFLRVFKKASGHIAVEPAYWVQDVSGPGSKQDYCPYPAQIPASCQ